MSTGPSETSDRRALFDDQQASVRGSVWVGRRHCWLALDGERSLIGAVVLPARSDMLMRVYAYGARQSWRGTSTRKHFYDLRTGTWSIPEVFADGVFPDGVAVRLIDPLTRNTVAESARTVRAPTPPGAHATITVDEAVALLGSVKSAYAAYELDARKLLTYPALIDPMDSISVAWYEAFAQACALEPEYPERCPPDHAGQFITATLAAEKAWETAEANARAVALDHLDAGQRNRIRRARRALDIALDPGAPAGERDAALAATLELIQGILELPTATSRRLRQAIVNGSQRPRLDAAPHRPPADDARGGGEVGDQ